MAEKYDAIVIGAGQSGPSLAARFASEGMKTAILERHLFGGTCVNVGCIPTKTLVASARAALGRPLRHDSANELANRQMIHFLVCQLPVVDSHFVDGAFERGTRCPSTDAQRLIISNRAG